MSEFVNSFSWSHSRRGLFETCLRKYYLNYYAFWKGWEWNAPPRVREIYIQKKLTTRPMWIGTVVHDMAEDALKELQGGRSPSPQAHLQRTLRRARQDIRDSERGLWRRRPSKITAFQEHYYDETVEPADWDQALEEIERQTTGFFQNPVFGRLSQVPEKILEVELLEQVLVGDVPVWVKLDALVADKSGGCVVIDWKTGKAHDSSVVQAQLGVYGLYCTLHHGFAPDGIVGMYVNLRSHSRQQHPLDQAMLDRTRDAIEQSAAAMRDLLRDPDGNVAVADDFPPLPPDSGPCRRCSFRRSCGRG